MFPSLRALAIAALTCLITTAVVAQDTTDSLVPAPAQPAGQVTPAVPNLSGFWNGSWSSNSNDHHGPMSATFCQLDANHYRVQFKGRFFELIPFNYTAVLTVTGYDLASGRVYLSGSHRLGPVFGTFSYNAWATNCQFVAGYCSQKNQGQFVMVRCC